mmetsp:Transcript_46855/g.151005  ORF Transcript_46855/g.151005 Transcript_46855/m.151005 type:complete len:251 (+) Transcript_46855:603-1355(+)
MQDVPVGDVPRRVGGLHGAVPRRTRVQLQRVGQLLLHARAGGALRVDVRRVQGASVRSAAVRARGQRRARCGAGLSRSHLREDRGGAARHDDAISRAVGAPHRGFHDLRRGCRSPHARQRESPHDGQPSPAGRRDPQGRGSSRLRLRALSGGGRRAVGPHLFHRVVQGLLPPKPNRASDREARVVVARRDTDGQRGADAGAALRDGPVLQGAPRPKLSALLCLGASHVHRLHVHRRPQQLHGRRDPLPEA